MVNSNKELCRGLVRSGTDTCSKPSVLPQRWWTPEGMQFRQSTLNTLWDRVRALGTLGMPEPHRVAPAIPRSGLAIRVMGEITEKLETG